MCKDKNGSTVIKAKTDFAGAALVLGGFATAILFIGEPDLHDVWVGRLTAEPTPAVAPESPSAAPGLPVTPQAAPDAR